MAYRVEIVEAARTHRLRRDVLRPGWTLEAVGALDWPSTTYAAFEGDSDEVISSATIFDDLAPPVIPAAVRGTQRHVHLRFMATLAGRQGQGIGGAVLAAVVAGIAEGGGGLLWCNAREAAMRFYAREGFRTAGDRFVEEGLGPHFVMWRLVEASGDDGTR